MSRDAKVKIAPLSEERSEYYRTRAPKPPDYPKCQACGASMGLGERVGSSERRAPKCWHCAIGQPREPWDTGCRVLEESIEPKFGRVRTVVRK